MMRCGLLSSLPWRLRRRCGIAVAVTAGVLAAHAAKNPDKPEKPDKFDKAARVEKIERKLERAGLTELPERSPARPVVAASGNERPAKAERSSKADRGEPGDSRGAATLPADPKFDTFRVILERNIFNPNRSPRSRATSEEKPPRVDEIALVGTMQYEKGLLAFFDSADSEFRKNLREGESIAGFEVRRITADRVELARGTEIVVLKVSQQLRRPEGADWVVSTTAPARGDAPEDVRAAAAAAATEIPTDASDVLKRLMKQREKLSK
jgi:hypothetical protein